jgi:uncharacterized protein (DUF1015 family)
MIEVFPFRALRPRADFAANVAAPPYDVISREEARSLAKGNPESFLRVTRSDLELDDGIDEHDPRVYIGARKNLEAFIARRTLFRDDEKSFYLYRLSTADHEQTGFVGCASIDAYSAGQIKIHEKTRPDKEEDRLEHIKTLEAQCEPVFLTHIPSQALAKIASQTMTTQALYDFETAEKVRHTLWKVAKVEQTAEAFRLLPALYIADGHHRSASAARAAAHFFQNNSRAPRNASFNTLLSYIVDESNVKILPYHRLLCGLGLSGSEILERISRVAKSSEADEGNSEHDEVRLFTNNRWFKVTLPSSSVGSPVEKLEASRLQSSILAPLFGITDPRTNPNIKFVGGSRGTAELEKRVRSREADCAFSLPAVSMKTVMDVADAGESMPPKSTWFAPKPLSGLFVHMFRRELGGDNNEASEAEFERL